MTSPAGSNLIANGWTAGAGAAVTSIDPATRQTVLSCHAVSIAQLDDAVDAARRALPKWASLPIETRASFLIRAAKKFETHAAGIAEAISRETGKPLWESQTEVKAMMGKAVLTIDAQQRRRHTEVADTDDGGQSATRYKPHGVLAVFGPFNLPGHLPNGHIMPALLAGNTVVFKSSERTPLTSKRMLEAWMDAFDEVNSAAGSATMPVGVINLVQGAADVGAALSTHDHIDGVLFTGGVNAGLALAKAMASRPGRILALEMGGNNPLVVHDVADVDAAARITVFSAYITSGQRCTCARRLFVPEGAPGDAFVQSLLSWIDRLRVGRWNEQPQPFMGPVISEQAGCTLLTAQNTLIANGADPLRRMQSIRGRTSMLTPALIDVTAVAEQDDREWFGPMLQMIRTRNLDDAIEQASATRFGLSAALLSDSREAYDQFYAGIRAGVVNWNRPTTGASGALPFGGVGMSGNHRPAGAWAVDYCSYPVASLESPTMQPPQLQGIQP